jgi:hypothetical protein
MQIDPEKGIIVSYQRSGLNWVRYCIEALTGLRTPGRPKLLRSGEVGVYRTHYVRKNKRPDSTACRFYGSDGRPLHSRVVLLLRDYRESFLRVSKSRHQYQLSASAIRNDKVFNFRHYFENLRAFDEFTGDKILVRYDHLVSDFTEVVRILDFLRMPYNLSGFDVEEHRAASLNIYNSQHQSFTVEDLYNFEWHQCRADTEVLEELDYFVRRHYRELAVKYLSWG